MCALRSSTMIFTESRNMLKPVKSTSKPSIEQVTKQNILLRAKKLSLDSESFMKSLQGKYEQKEPEPPPVVGLGVRRYKGSKSYLGSGRDIPVELAEEGGQAGNKSSNSLSVGGRPGGGADTVGQRKKSMTNGHIDSILQKIKEEPVENNDIELTPDEFNNNEEEAQVDLNQRLNEVEEEIEDIYKSFLDEDLDLASPVRELDSGTSRQHDAAANGDLAALKRLIKDGCNVNDSCEDGCTPLQLACSSGHTTAVRLLAKHGGNLDVVDKLGRSLLHTAVLGGHNNMVAALIHAGTNASTRDNRRGRTPLHVAAVENELVMIKMLVQALKDDPWGSMPLLSITDKDGRTPLHVAASKGSVEAVKLLLSVGFSVTKKDIYGNTPMHAVLALNHANKRCRLILRMLLEAGGDLAIKEEHPLDGEDFQLGKRCRDEDFIELQDPTLVCSFSSNQETNSDANIKEADRNGHSDPDKDANNNSNSSATSRRSSLQNGNATTAVGTGNESSKIINKGGNGTETSTDGISKSSSSSVIGRRVSLGGWVDEAIEHVERMIHMAARVGCGGCLALLIEYGAPVNSRDRRERTPLHLTAESNRPNAARTLTSLGASIDAMDCRSHTPLHAAIGANCGPMVEVLLNLGAAHHIRDPIGRSYAEHALFSRKMDAFRSLVKCGVTGVAEEGSSILHCSATVGCLTSTQMLLDMGWDSNVSDSKGLTPLHSTIGQGYEDIATLLITEGANIMQRDNKGATPLHYAVRWGGSDALLRMLVKRGASLAAKDRLGRTPLHYAASKFSIMSDMYIILGGGATLNPADLSGLTPLHLAARLGNESLVRILLDKGANPTLTDMYNFTAYDHAKENKHASIMKRLEDYMKLFNKNNNITTTTNDASKTITTTNGVMNGSVENRQKVSNGLAAKDITAKTVSNNFTVTNSSQKTRQNAFQMRAHRTSIAW